MKNGVGKMDKETSFKLLDAYFDAGGNFIDVANNYQDETSEKILGEWAEKREIRDQLVIATKYSANYKDYDDSVPQRANFTGNGAKSLRLSLDASLKKLRTSYIDILYVHYWDFETSVEEIMNSLHNLVAAGKELYLGISDTPAWVVTKANTYVRLTGKTPFAVYQGRWNVLERSFERDIIPMCRCEGLAIAPWGVVGGGLFRTEAEQKRREQSGDLGRTMLNAPLKGDEAVKMSLALEKVANEVGVGDNITAVAIAYTLQKAPYVFPVVGGRRVEHLLANTKALEISLTPDQIKYLESVVPFDPGFPSNMIGDGTTHCFLLSTAAHLDKNQLLESIKPSQA